MQRHGIGFGAHLNAATTFDQTYYMLDLPNATNKEALDLVFNVMRDWGDGILLDEEEIEKERGVILSEMTARDSVDFRLTKQLWEFLLPGHILPSRWPIGEEDVIKTAPRQRFVDFYNQYYTPERMTVVAVGDANPEEIEQRIMATFKDMVPQDEDYQLDDVELGSVNTQGTGFEAAVFSDNELVNEEIFVTFSRPYVMPEDTKSHRASQFALAFAHGILSRRLGVVAKKEGSPFRKGSASGGGRAGLLGRSSIETGSIDLTLASGIDNNWQSSIPILEQEFRRALEFGFAQYELDEMEANYRSYYQSKVDTASTRKSSSLANGLRNTIKDESVFTTPEQDLQIFSDAMESLMLVDIHEAFKKFWDTSDLKLVLYTKEAEPDATTVMEQAYKESQQVQVEPPPMEVDLSFAYTPASFGEPGEIVSDTLVEDLDIRQVKLSNNIRVNLKKTDFQANTIAIAGQFGTGKLSQDPNKPGIQWLAPQLLNSGGLGKHSIDDLQRILAGKNVEVSFQVGEGSFSLSGKTTPDDLELQMQLMAAQLTDPGFRPEALQYWTQSTVSYEQMFKSQVRGAQFYVEEYLRGDDRYVVPTLEEMQALTIDDVKEWLEPQLSQSYLEISIVGDFDMDSTINSLLITFGALPERDDSPQEVDGALRNLNLPERPTEQAFTYESKLPSASAIVVWDVPHLEKDISPVRHLKVLSSMLRDRLRTQIREDIGESYSPRASTDISDDFIYGIMRAESPCTADVSTSLGQQIISIAKDMTSDVSEDELFRAKEPILTSVDEQVRSNSYWINSMRESQANSYKLDWIRSLKDDYSSVTLGQVKELAAVYLQPGNAIRVEINPVNVDEVE